MEQEDAGLRELLAGVDVVFHLAGIAHQQAGDADYQQLNHRATLRLAGLAADAGVRRFVFLSSVKAMGPATTDSQRAEADCAPPGNAYGLSKWRAECDLRATCGDSPMAVYILRPALVYGVGARGNLALLARAVRAGLPRPPLAGGRSMVALDDLVDLLCLLADRGPGGVHTWIVTDGETYTTRYIYDQMRRAAGKGRGIGWLPLPLWRLLASLWDVLQRNRGEATFDKLFGAERYSNAALLAATGWHPRRTLGEIIPHIMTSGNPAR